MVAVEENPHSSIRFALTYLKVMSFWTPPNLTENQKCLHFLYFCFMFMFTLGITILFQIVDLFMVWGSLEAMTEIAAVLFTNLALATKIVNLFARRHAIRALIDQNAEALRIVTTEKELAIVGRLGKETWYFLCTYVIITSTTAICCFVSQKEGILLVRAWYPYNTSTPVLFQLTYTHQALGTVLAAFSNVALDMLVVSLIAQLRCRLLLLRHSLLHIHAGLSTGTGTRSNQGLHLLYPAQEQTARARLRSCVLSHQSALATAAELQRCFSEPTFAQFSVSLVIICVSAYQMASQIRNPLRLLFLATYLLDMMFQVFIYCYQGSQLREVSVGVVEAAYGCGWYRSGIPFRRSLSILMLRALRPVDLTAAKFTSLNLDTFMAVIKMSYSLFTVLQQVKEE